jgi:uncharacterized membrane protein
MCVTEGSDVSFALDASDAVVMQIQTNAVGLGDFVTLHKVLGAQLQYVAGVGMAQSNVPVP